MTLFGRFISRDVVQFFNFVKITTMGFFNLTKRVRPKEFTYIPMHYDEDEEKRKELFGEYDENDIDASKLRIQRGLRRGSYYYEKPNVSKLRKRSNMMTLGIALFLVFAILFVIVTNLERILALAN